MACCRRKQTIYAKKTAGDKPPPYNKRSADSFVRTPFHTPCLARYSVLHLIGVLSGENEPPLCKGRWLAKQDGGIVKSKILQKNNPSAAFGVSSLYTREPFSYVHIYLVKFPDKHCFCRHKSETTHEAKMRISSITFYQCFAKGSI